MPELTPEAQRLLYKYNGDAYDPSSNPGGMDNNGHTINLIPSFRDVAAIGQYAATMALVASQYAASTTGWSAEVAEMARLSGTQFNVLGDKTIVYQKNRAIAVTQTLSGFGYVADASFADGKTTVTVFGILLDAGFTAVALGQALENAPCAPNLATTLFITSNFVTA